MSYVGKLLVATPAIDDDMFHQAVVFIFFDEKEGVLGVMINKPSSEVLRAGLSSGAQKRVAGSDKHKYQLFNGGPVESSKLFVLASEHDDGGTDTVKLHSNADEFISDVVAGRNGGKFLLCNGFCGWEHEQLQEELNTNSWIVVNATMDIIFNEPPQGMWQKIAQQYGIMDSLQVVPYSGHA